MSRSGEGLTPASFEAFFHSVAVALFVHDGERILACNDALASLFGCKRSDIEGGPMWRFVDPASVAVVERHLSSDPTTYEAIALRPDGSSFAVIVRPSEMRLDGRKVRVVAMEDAAQRDEDLAKVRDEITHKEEMRRLRETNEFKTHLLNTTAHELNTPLTPVRLQLHLLQSGALGPLSERQEKALGILDRNAARLSFLVNDILDVARLESGRMEVNRTPQRLGALLEESIESYEETARRVGVELRLDASADGVVDVDGDRVTQILYNLIGNALKFTPDGGRVDVRTRMDDGQAVIEVQDTGPGLTAEQIGRLFQPFSRVHDTQQSTVAGTGLGLYICKGIVEAHDGAIEAISPGPGRGCTFRVTMPLAQETPLQVVPQPAPQAARKEAPVDALAQRLRELI